jgi:hypothetical protein
MDPLSLHSKTFTIDIYLRLSQFPILAEKIRARMRDELFSRGILSQAAFDKEVEQKAIESQWREGLYDPFSQEPAPTWERRKEIITAHLTDAYFASNLTHQILEQLIHEVLNAQQVAPRTIELTFNPELAPWEMLFQQGEIYEQMPPPEQEQFKHHLEEIKVVLIKRMISEHLQFIAVAKKAFCIADLRQIHQRRIGRGKIGGKAAGMMLAWKILQQHDPDVGPDISQHVGIADSYFMGTEVIYEFRRINNLDHYMNQKYRPLDEIRAEYPRIVEAHLKGQFPDSIVEHLRSILAEVGDTPLIVRSSSLLEDNFGFSFAGKYLSCFLPNQGTAEENLQELLNAIRSVYASTLNPDAILYRKQHGLIDYDERMAILLQCVRGKQYGRYYFPTVAGVGFSQNSYRWSPQIRREDGFLRMVCGLGTRAVDRVANDYPRLVALSHPHLRPETNARAVRQYAQRYVDAIDLKGNAFVTLPVQEVLHPEYPMLRYVASIDKGDFMQNIVSTVTLDSADSLVLTFDYLTKDRNFVKLMRTALMRLEKAYGTPVDTEFTLEITPNFPHPEYKLYLLQCRPLSLRAEVGTVEIPKELPPEDVLFTSHQLIPDGRAEGIRYVLFVDPEAYRRLRDQTTKLELGRAIGRLNKVLENEPYILIGPGRWGSANIELGVRVTYADIYNTKVLIELAVATETGVPELSYGTHFYQDLVEAGIYSLPIHLNDGKSSFNWEFFRQSSNVLAQLAPADAPLQEWLRVIEVPAAAYGRRLNILMDGTHDEAMGFLAAGDWHKGEGQASLSNF